MSVDAYMQKVKEFCGYLAPGMVCGGFMVELAYQNLPENGYGFLPSKDGTFDRAYVRQVIQRFLDCGIRLIIL